ncbi:MAG TPA: hypothetical protein VF587_03690, partial [Solirubrobacteraceae bacterium]
MTRAALACFVVLASLVSAAPAGAARVTWTPGGTEAPGVSPEESCSRYMACAPPTMLVSDDVGERNDLVVEAVPGFVVVRDAAAPLETSAPCTKNDDGSVSCPGGAYATVQAGAGNDRVVAPAYTVYGDAGDDELAAATAYGGEGADTLTGSDAANFLTPGPGADAVDGRGGDDVIIEGEPAPTADRLDGGEGNDEVRFDDRPVPVRVDLTFAQQEAGSFGEGNVVSNFERAAGGAGDDELLGP